MVILKTFSLSGRGAVWDLSWIFLFIGIIFLVLFIINIVTTGWEVLFIYPIGIIAFVIVLCICGLVTSRETQYYIYPNGASIEEIESEYDIVKIDEKIVQAFKKKGEMK